VTYGDDQSRLKIAGGAAENKDEYHSRSTNDRARDARDTPLSMRASPLSLSLSLSLSHSLCFSSRSLFDERQLQPRFSETSCATRGASESAKSCEAYFWKLQPNNGPLSLSLSLSLIVEW
jgi:hypothetical protein